MDVRDGVTDVDNEEVAFMMMMIEAVMCMIRWHLRWGKMGWRSELTEKEMVKFSWKGNMNRICLFSTARSNKENRLEEKEVPSTMLEVDVTEGESVLPPDILYMLKSIKWVSIS